MIKKAQTNYKDKVKGKLEFGNARDAWRGLNKMMDRQQRFYSRFDKQDFSDQCEAVCTGMTPCPMILQEREVISMFQSQPLQCTWSIWI